MHMPSAKTLISVYAQADLSLRWSHKLYCRFCRLLSQLLFGLHSGFQANPQRGNNVVTTLLQRRDVAATL